MASIRTGLAWSFVERYMLIGLSLASYVLIARLLTPTEIGIYSVTAALVGIAQVIREFGVGNYIVQERDLDLNKLETAYGFSLILAVAIFAITNGCAPMLADFYDEPRMLSVMRVMLLNILILPFCSIALGVLRRAMRFDAILIANVLGAVFGISTTLLLATMKAGPSSLAWGIVACNIATAVCAWMKLDDSSRPKRPRLVHWRTVFAYGRQSTPTNAVVAVAMDINDMIVAKVIGFGPVALLSRGLGIMYMFQRDLLGAARNVALPAYAAASREGKGVEPMFVYTFSCVTVIGWTFYGFLVLFPLESTHLLVGAQWDAAVPYVMLFSVAGALLCLAPLTQTVIIATGQVALAARADLITSLMRLALVAIAAAVFRTLNAVAWAMFISLVLSIPIFVAYKHQVVRNDWPALATQAYRGILVTLGALFIPATVSINAGLDRMQPLSTGTFGVMIAATLFTWPLMLRWCGHPLARDPIYLGTLAKVSTWLRRSKPA